jgi:hypothetical protein
MPSRRLSSYAALVDSLQICTIILEWEAILSAVLMASPTSSSGGNTCQQIIYFIGLSVKLFFTVHISVADPGCLSRIPDPDFYPSRIPQGTVIGPTLFTVYIDDLELEVVAENLDVLIVKFADDTKGAKVIRGEEDRQKLQQALDILCEWVDKWGMSFNVAKCKIMHVGRNIPGYAYFMNGTQVGTTDEERDI